MLSIPKLCYIYQFSPASILDNKTKVDDFPSMISHTLSKSYWIDRLQRHIRISKATLNESILWCKKIQQETGDDTNDNDPKLLIMDLFLEINRVIYTENYNLSDEEIIFKDLAHLHLIHHNKKDDHVPVLILPYMKPTMDVSFMLHGMLSMGQFGN